MNSKKILVITEILGSVVLSAVLLGAIAVLRIQLSDFFSHRGLGILIVAMLLIVTTAICFSFYRISGRQIGSHTLTLFGIKSIVIGSIVVYAVPSYFSMMLSLPLEFWHTVCIFSLPVVCIEIGLFTLFTELQNKKGLTTREQQLLVALFLVYFTLAITINFIVINRLWAVHHQIWFYRTLVFFVLLIFFVVSHKKK